MRLLPADQAEQVPGAIRQHRAVDLRVILNRRQQALKASSQAPCDCGEGGLGAVHALGVHGFAERLASGAAFGQAAGGSTGCRISLAGPPYSWIRFVLR